MSALNLDKIKKIKMLVMDVDGIMTDTRIVLGSDGEWKRFFSVRDGIGIVHLMKMGYKTAVITGSNSPDVRKRMQGLKIDYFYENKLDKIPAFEELKAESGFSDEEISYIGDDVYDIPLLQMVGFSATVPEAIEEVKKECDYITERNGGYGAVRDLCHMILSHGHFS
ncbi:MAG: HAD hydrolase family protein [Bdellovibrionales bacterium]|nr:HAD hydrolase family protein [Bdellovibrionales bacterium]